MWISIASISDANNQMKNVESASIGTDDTMQNDNNDDNNSLSSGGKAWKERISTVWKERISLLPF